VEFKAKFIFFCVYKAVVSLNFFCNFVFVAFCSDFQRKHQDFLKSLLIIDMISVERRIFAFYMFANFATAQTTTQINLLNQKYKRPLPRISGLQFSLTRVWCWNVEKQLRPITWTYPKQQSETTPESSLRVREMITRLSAGKLFA
jgi:hypothetical protein